MFCKVYTKQEGYKLGGHSFILSKNTYLLRNIASHKIETGFVFMELRGTDMSWKTTKDV